MSEQFYRVRRGLVTIHVAPSRVNGEKVTHFHCNKKPTFEHSLHGKVSHPGMFLEVTRGLELVPQSSGEVAHVLTGSSLEHERKRFTNELRPDDRGLEDVIKI